MQHIVKEADMFTRNGRIPLFVLLLTLSINVWIPANLAQSVDPDPPSAFEPAVRLTDYATTVPFGLSYNLRPIMVNNRLLLTNRARSDRQADAELWAMDTAENISFLTTLEGNDSIPGIQALVANGSFALIFANNRSIWRTDGTPQGTTAVTDLPASHAFVGSSSYSGLSWANAQNGIVSFVTFSNGTYTVWNSDGTATGTVERFSVVLSPVSSQALPMGTALLPNGNLLHAVSDEAGDLRALEVISGPAPSDRQIIAAWNAGQYKLAHMILAQQNVFFLLTGQTASVLWRSDGTAPGTFPLINTGPTPSACQWNQAGGQVVGICRDGDTSMPYLLIHSDGTPSGSHVYALTIEGFSFGISCLPGEPIGIRLPLYCRGWGSGRMNAFFGMFVVVDAARGNIQYGYRFSDDSTTLFNTTIAAFHDRWILSLSVSDEVYSTDGSELGTHAIQYTTSGSPLITLYPSLNERAIYTIGDEREVRTLYGVGIADGAALLATFDGQHRYRPLPFLGQVSSATDGKQRLIWQPLTDSSAGVRAVFASDGTSIGTQPASAFPFVIQGVQVQDRLYVLGYKQGVGYGLWETDGTPGAVQLLIPLGIRAVSSQEGFVVAANGRFYFNADDGVHGKRLWVSDGTDAGTRMAVDLFPGIMDIPAWLLTSTANGNVYMTLGRTIWVSNGSAAGTQQLSNESILLQDPYRSFIASGNKLYFMAKEDLYTTPWLWATDGTPGGTQPLITEVSKWMPGSNGRLYFVHSTPSSGEELWVSDGTPGGTYLVADVAPGTASSQPTPYVLAPDGRLLFAADDGTYGRELWITNGTSGGTQRLTDIAVGALGSEIDALTWIGSTLFFAANDGTHGRELWWWDGTTFQFQDLYPGIASSNPEQFTRGGNVVYFMATDNAGREIWALPIGPASLSVHGSALGGPPGETGSLSIGYGNLGGSTGPVTITLTLGTPMEAAGLPTYLTDTSGVSPTISGNQVQWHNLPGDALVRRQIRVLLAMPEGVPGTRYPVQLRISAPMDARLDDNVVAFDIPLAWNRWIPSMVRP